MREAIRVIVLTDDFASVADLGGISTDRARIRMLRKARQRTRLPEVRNALDARAVIQDYLPEVVAAIGTDASRARDIDHRVRVGDRTGARGDSKAKCKGERDPALEAATVQRG